MQRSADSPMPVQAGIGLRDPHFEPLLQERLEGGWLEAHTENFFGHNDDRHRVLTRLRERHPLSLHGVGLSLGSSGPLDPLHLAAVQELVTRYEPWLVSEHLCWGGIHGRHSNNLLPLPYTKESLDTVCAHVDAVQNRLRQRIALENISSYLEWNTSTFPETEFITEVVNRSGCLILLDINNLYVNAVNHGIDALAYLRALPADAVAEFHLAGHEDLGHTLIDTHGAAVAAPVWTLFEQALGLLGPRPTLIEWDTNLPALPVLLQQAQQAGQRLNDYAHVHG